MKKLAKYVIFNLLIRVFLTLGGFTKKSQFKGIANFIGHIAYLLPWKRKRIAKENLKIAFPSMPEENINAILKSFIKEVFLIALEVASIIKRKEKFSSYASVWGIENLDNAMSKGKGAIALSGHIGNIVVLIGWFAEKGYPVAVLFKEGKYLPKGFLYNLIKRYGGYPIPFHSDEEVVREIVRALNKKMLVFMLADQARPGVYAKFFDKYVQCQKGAFVISQRKGSPLVPLFIVRESERYSIKIFPEIDLNNTNFSSSQDREIKIIEAVEKYNFLLESLIREHPEQYYWFHRRFKKMKNC
ncbi:lysophospholipid acyltransferase family protein [Thermodesulfovibrio sp.]|uniref:lysophospholipid acyltransferase family protein n=1 Tax=Thermodesulfovibrio sp. TaxID=2067987 RepID=UPI0030A54714